MVIPMVAMLVLVTGDGIENNYAGIGIDGDNEDRFFYLSINSQLL
jgi:hypothetical protein